MVDERDEPTRPAVRPLGQRSRSPGRRHYDRASWESGGAEWVAELERRVDDHDHALDHSAQAIDRLAVAVDKLATSFGETRAELQSVKLNQRWILLLGAAIVTAASWLGNYLYDIERRVPRAVPAPSSVALTAEARITEIQEAIPHVGTARTERTVDGKPRTLAILALSPSLRWVGADERDEACRRAELVTPGVCSKVPARGP